MSGNEQDQNRNLPATQFKLNEARKKGSVAKSVEINALASLFALLIGLYGAGYWMLSQQASTHAALLSRAYEFPFQTSELVTLFAQLAKQIVMILSPILLFGVIFAILINLLQTGPVFSFFPIKPDLTRLNPIQGLKRVFSMKTVVDALKSVLKLIVFTVIGYLAIVAFLPVAMGLMSIEPDGYSKVFLQYGLQLLFFLFIAMAFIAMLDLIHSRHEFAKKMRMSFREVKEEIKRREGDPDIRSKRKQIQRELLQKAQSLANVKNADVVITNPTHYAIALQYDRETMDAPRVIAKGTDEFAQKIKQEARKYRIPLVENRRLARQLHDLSRLNDAIPEAVFPKVAHILAWVFGLREDLREGVSVS